MTPLRRRDRPRRRGAPRAGGLPLRVQARRRRPGRDARAAARRAAHRRPRAARGRARPGQDADRAHARDRCSAARFSRIQFTPDLVPADLVGTRIWQPGDGTFRTELGPVFANLLLADEINRAPAKVQSALLEVMQEHQVTIGGETHRVPEPVPRARHAEPDRVRGHLRRCPRRRSTASCSSSSSTTRRSRTRSPSSTASSARAAAAAQRARRSTTCSSYQQAAREVFADRAIVAYAVALVDATRHPARYGLADLEPLIEFGASPRASLGLVQAGARARAAARPHARRRRTTSATSRRRAAPPAGAVLRRARRPRAARTS